MKKILLVTDAWAPQRNGVTTVLSRLSLLLEKRGYEVAVIHPELFRTVPLPVYPEIHLALFPRRRVARMIEELQPDAIHLMTEGPLAWAARSICIKQSIPFTTWYHTHLQLYTDVRLHGLLRPVNALLRRFHARATRTIVTTKSLKRELEANGYCNVVVVPLGVDTDLFVRNPSPPLLALPKPIFVYFGRVAIEKNVEEFLRLDLPGSKLVIGDGPLKAKLVKHYPKAHFLPRYQIGKEFIDKLSACDVFVFPSRTETFGLVVLEALACGIPVAAHDVMGPRDSITHGKEGYLSDDLADAAVKCLALSREDCRAKALQYSWEASVDAFITNLSFIHRGVDR